MNQQSEHLSNAQIEQYGKRASGAGPETEAWVETHLDDCPSCRGRVLEFQRTQFALLPDPKVNTVSSSNCPCEEDLRNLAAGLSAEPIAGKLKAHASNCERCGPLLQEYIEDFSDESSPEEHAFLNQLRTTSPEFRQQKALEMLNREMLKKNLVTPAPVPATDWRRFFSWKWIMTPAAAAAACVLLAFASEASGIPARHARKSRKAAGPGVYGAEDDGDEVARSGLFSLVPATTGQFGPSACQPFSSQVNYSRSLECEQK